MTFHHQSTISQLGDRKMFTWLRILVEQRSRQGVEQACFQLVADTPSTVG
jgi:hypothetical protein